MKKEPLVLLPGTLCDRAMWEEQVEELSNIAEIIIGDVGQHSSIQELADSVLEDAPEEFSIVGFSLGGIVALEIMRIAPERINKLALISTNPFPPTKEQQVLWEKYIEMIENNQFIEVVKRKLYPALVSKPNQSGTTLEKVLNMAKNIGPKAYINQLKSVMTRNDQRPILKKINCPTVIIVGELDKVCPVELSDYLNKNIEDSQKVVIEGAGHLITLEKPYETSQILKQWMKD